MVGVGKEREHYQDFLKTCLLFVWPFFSRCSCNCAKWKN